MLFFILLFALFPCSCWTCASLFRNCEAFLFSRAFLLFVCCFCSGSYAWELNAYKQDFIHCVILLLGTCLLDLPQTELQLECRVLGLPQVAQNQGTDDLKAENTTHKQHLIHIAFMKSSSSLWHDKNKTPGKQSGSGSVCRWCSRLWGDVRLGSCLTWAGQGCCMLGLPKLHRTTSKTWSILLSWSLLPVMLQVELSQGCSMLGLPRLHRTKAQMTSDL